jgi:transposase
LEKETERNVELMWLIRKLRPDFRSIADFRKDNKEALKEVFQAFNRFCDSLGLYTKEYLSIDGSKFKAVNAKDRNFTLNKLDDRLKRLDEHIEEYMAQLDRRDEVETGDERQFSAQEIKEKLKALEERKNRYEGYREELERNGEKQVSLTDRESRLMKFSEGFNVGYNVQSVVDAGSHLIADFQVTNQGTDHGLLEQVAGEVKAAFGVQTLETVADKGYQDKEDMMGCLERGIIPHVHPRRGEDGFDLETVYEERQISEEQRTSREEEKIKECLRAGVIPEAYETVITRIDIVEKRSYPKAGEEQAKEAAAAGDSPEGEQEKAREGFFVRNVERDLVYCPGGEILRLKSNKRSGAARYCNKLACKECQDKCTDSKFKEVDFLPGDTMVSCAAYGQSGEWKQRQNRHGGPRGSAKTKVVRLHFKVDRRKLDTRKCLSEHPFGTIKRTLDSAYLLLKGIKKVTGELSLSFMAYNMRRAINMAGVGKMIEALDKT